MSENKKKYAYWMKPSMVEEITEMLDEANATSKSDFVCQAVQFYIGYLHQQKCIDYLSPILAQTIKSEIESVEKNVSEMRKLVEYCNHHEWAVSLEEMQQAYEEYQKENTM